MKIVRSWRCLAFLEMMINTSWFLVVEQNKIWTSFARNEVYIALLIFCGHPPISLKYALHHLSPGGIFLYLVSLSCIVSLLGCAISQLWNLNHIISLLSDAVSHHVSEIWTTSPSSNIWSWCCIISPLRACSCNVKVLVAFSSHLQGFVSIFLHPQSLDGSFFKLQGFVGISLHLQSLDRISLHLQKSCWHH